MRCEAVQLVDQKAFSLGGVRNVGETRSLPKSSYAPLSEQ